MRVGLSQRVEHISSYGERRDCLDQQWYVLLEAMDMDGIAIPNGLREPLDWLARQKLDALILTGGNDLATLPDAKQPAPERDATETALLEWAQRCGIPVLGVCRGLQMMNHFCGGSLSAVGGHVATRHALQCADGDALFSHYHEVNSYHNMGILADDLARDMKVRAQALSDDSIEAVSHATLPWIGIMWHPERELPFHNTDMTLIDTLFRTRSCEQ